MQRRIHEILTYDENVKTRLFRRSIHTEAYTRAVSTEYLHHRYMEESHSQ